MDLLQRLGNDRVVMILGVLIGLARGTNYVFLPGISDLTGHLILVNGYVPVWALGALWYFAGAFSLLALFWKRLVPLAYGVLITLATMSALLFLASWIFGFSPGGFTSAASYVAKATLLYIVARTPQVGEDVQEILTAETGEIPEVGGART